jgi:hypothetical protein
LPIFDVQVQCYPKHVTFELFRTSNIAAEIGAFQFLADQLPSGDKRPFNCKGWKWYTGTINGMHFVEPGPLFLTTAADVYVCTQFRVAPFISVNWPCVVQFFKTEVDDADGKTYWREVRPELKRVR